ncbi:MAG: hypothetical protein IPO88_27885 [Nannocystis sp.]|uniref:hypothetical protein n=1 Tax=Nannocystis sp. TaxID=1962667 RepID=UPI002425854D|nr:hypothetical protein [Nannocystis sp.]MBK9757251.1 hypothetical protein [Nannocystis sp.]
MYPALRFAEKPDAVRARIFVETGHFLWNAGIFLDAAGARRGGAGAPRAPRKRALARSRGAARPPGPRPAAVTAYDAITAEAIDIAVMEKQRDLCVILMRYRGRTSARGRRRERSRTAATTSWWRLFSAAVQLIDRQGVLVWSEGLEVAVLRMRDVAVVVSGGGAGCPLDRAEEVRPWRAPLLTVWGCLRHLGR